MAALPWIGWAATLAALATLAPALTFYQELGIPEKSNARAVKRAYRKLMLELHPDKLGNNTSQELADQFLRIQAAYEVLGDPDQKDSYDDIGHDAWMGSTGRGGGGGGGTGEQGSVVPDLGTQHFSVVARLSFGAFELYHTPPRPSKAGSVLATIEVTLEELLRPHRVEVTFQRQRLCPACSGIGALTPDHVHVCKRCQGSGLAWFMMPDRGVGDSVYSQGRGGQCRRKRSPASPDPDARAGAGTPDSDHTHDGGHSRCVSSDVPKKPYEHAERRPCPVCGARGFVWSAPCETCHGTGTHEDEISLPFIVPSGALHGHMYKFEAQGHQELGKADGDAIVVVHRAPHPRFAWVPQQPHDLQFQATIGFVEALTGFNRSMTLLNGTRIPIRRRGITFSGQTLVVEGGGLPLSPDELKRRQASDPQLAESFNATTGAGYPHGDLVVVFRVDFPSHVTPRLIEQLQDLLDPEQLEVVWAIMGLHRQDEADRIGSQATYWEIELTQGCGAKDPFRWELWGRFGSDEARARISGESRSTGAADLGLGALATGRAFGGGFQGSRWSIHGGGLPDVRAGG